MSSSGYYSGSLANTLKQQRRCRLVTSEVLEDRAASWRRRANVSVCQTIPVGEILAIDMKLGKNGTKITLPEKGNEQMSTIVIDLDLQRHVHDSTTTAAATGVIPRPAMVDHDKSPNTSIYAA